MSTLLSNLFVVIAIVVSACYCLWRLGPRRTRDGLRMRLRKILPGVFGDSGGVNAASGCDACGGCEAAARSNSHADNTFVLKRR